MKIIRWILGIFFTLLAAIAVAIVLLVNFVNPSDYRDQISQTISQKINMPFAIHGDINWLFFPELGFKVNDIAIGSTLPNTLSAKLNHLEINLKILPLLHKQIQIEALRLTGLQLVLPYQAPSNNTKQTSNNTAAVNSTNNVLGGLAALPSLDLADLTIDKSDITQLDIDGKTAWALHDFSFSGVNININNKFPLQTNFNFEYPSQKLLGTANFKTYLGINVDKQQMLLSKPALNFSLTKDSGTAIKGNITLAEIETDFIQHSMILDQLKGQVGGLTINSNAFTIKNFDTEPGISGSIKAQSEELKAFLNNLGVHLPDTQNGNVFGHFALDTDVKFEKNQLSLNPLKVSLGDTQLQGNVTSPDVKNLALNVKLASPAIAVGDYLPKSATPKRVNINNLTLSANILPPASNGDTNWLASTMTGNITSQAIDLNGQKFDNVQLTFDGKNKVIHFSKLHTNAFKGTIDGSAVVNLQGNEPQFTLAPVIQNVQIHDLLASIEPKSDLSGTANLSGTINTQGSDAKTLTRNLNGNLKTHINHGVLHGIDVNYWLSIVSSLYHRDFSTMPQQPKDAKTEFNDISATLNINQGVVNNNDLIIQTAFARATGKGTIDLNRDLLNYHVQIVKLNQATGKAHNDIVPLNITGSFDNPSIQPDMSMIAQQVVSKQVDKYKDKVSEKISEKLGGGEAGNQVGQAIGNALGNLLGSK